VERLKTEPKSVPGTDELKMEVSRLWARLGSAEREREAMESELRGLRSSLALAESERDTWKTKAQSLEDQAADPTELSDALSRAVESADQWRQRAEDAQRLLAESVARHASEMAELRDRIQSLQAAEPAHGNEVLVAERNLALAERDRLQAQLVEAEARLRLAHASLRQAPAIWEARTHPEERHDEEERAIQATQNRPALSEAEEGQGRDSARAAQLESQLRQADRVIEDLRSQIARLEHALRQTRPSTGGFVAPGAGRLTAIPGLTQTAERRLAACGIGSLAQLAALDPDDPSVDPDLLTELPDLREWIERARRILEVGGP
jgi:chromosome segregation ATPase